MRIAAGFNQVPGEQIGESLTVGDGVVIAGLFVREKRAGGDFSDLLIEIMLLHIGRYGCDHTMAVIGREL